jgi:hypothetical protein
MITTADLRAFLGIDPADAADDAWLGQCVGAVNAWVARLPVVHGTADDSWPNDVTVGAIMLAAHEYHARNAPGGRAGYDIAGGFSQAYADPEIARLLRLRRWARPMITGAT